MSKNKKKKKKGIIFKFFAFWVGLFCRRSQAMGLENIPDEPCIIAGNHSKLYGPINAELYFPTEKLIWCDGPMMDKKEFPKYAYANFFGGKPNFFCKVFVRIMTPLITFLFKRADALPVYRDMRIMKTYKLSLEAINAGKNIVILPECPEEHNEIVNKFNEYFVDVARICYKHNNKELKFVPMYYSKNLRKMIFGKPIQFDAKNDIEKERTRICEYLIEQISILAKSLPRHKVIPYNNVNKKDYKFSK